MKQTLPLDEHNVIQAWYHFKPEGNWSHLLVYDKCHDTDKTEHSAPLKKKSFTLT